MIRIVNWILTRKCNLKCDYCAIVKDYHDKPPEYPNIDYYHKHEMGTTTILNALAKFKKHNPDCFHILYGGEPMLRRDLPEIIEYCHRHSIHYTIISNNTKEIQPFVKKLINQVGNLKGYTSSVDPILVDDESSLGQIHADRLKKTKEGFEFLLWMKDYCDDVVAEVTVMREDQYLTHRLVKFLSTQGINSDVTFIDIAKTRYYDFSNVGDLGMSVHQSPELADQMMNILIDQDIDVHMKNYLIPETYKILPSNMDCEIEKSLHNVTIDADGSVRLCLRVRGVHTPTMVNVPDLIDLAGYVNPVAHRLICKDKLEFCKLCNHTCQLMSKIIDEKNLGPEDLVHLDRR